MWRCKMRRCEDVKWEYVRMFENVYNRPPLLIEPFAQTLWGIKTQNAHTHKQTNERTKKQQTNEFCN